MSDLTADMAGTSIAEPPSLCRKNAVILPPEIEFMPGAISGHMLLARFTLPCAWYRFQTLQIGMGDWTRLLAIALDKSGREYTVRDQLIVRGLLSGLFSRLIAGLYEYRGPDKTSNAWSYQNVLEYLLEHKGHADECAAKCLTVGADKYLFAGTELSPITGDLRDVFWATVNADRYCRLFDLYQIRPKAGSRVLAHKSVIVADITDIDQLTKVDAN